MMFGKEVFAPPSLGKPVLQQIEWRDVGTGFEAMKVPSARTKILATALAILVASALHYVTPHSRLFLHNLFQKLYYLPIIYAAISFGWRGGILAAVASALCYIPHILTWRHEPYYAMSQYAELILFFLVGATTGLLADQGRRRRVQLEATTRQLQESFEQVKRADRLSAVGQLAASLAHEIRNPLGSIEGATNIIRSPATSEEIREGSLNIIQKECQRLNRLLTNLLDFARPRQPEFRAVDLPRLIDSIFALVGPNAQLQHVTLKKSIVRSPAILESDPEQLKQVLLNLVINAIQAMPGGGEIEVEVDHRDSEVMISVRDEGAGIDDQNLDKIFDRFFTTKEAGTGLGLSVAHQVITQHGGHIKARSESGPRNDFLHIPPSALQEQALRKSRLLVVDDDESLRWVTKVQMEQSGYTVDAAADGPQALALLQQNGADLVITDLMMPGMSGLDLLKEIRREYPDLAVIVVTAFGTVETAVEAMKAGAYDYITKPVNIDELKLIVSRALEHLNLKEEVRTLRSSLDRKYGFENILGRSKSLLHVLDMASRAAHTNTTVLIRGETGTGKELLAKAIHFNSPRKDSGFVTINCGAIPKDLIESELFGHIKGSFTGALANKRGLVELADGGSLFLDEIGELPLELQVKLLRLIQQGEVAKVGAMSRRQGGCPGNRGDAPESSGHGGRRHIPRGPYYRLTVIPLELPPLRDRPEDIPELVQYFFVKAKEKHGRSDLKLPPSLLPRFAAYTWPGNVRELENIVERLVVLTPATRSVSGPARVSAARAPRDRSTSSGSAATRHQPGRRREGTHPQRAEEVQLEPDPCRALSGPEPKDSDLPHGKIQHPAGRPDDSDRRANSR